MNGPPGTHDDALDRTGMVTIVQSSPMPTVLFDLPHGTIHAASEPAERVLGLAGARLVGRRITDLMADPEPAWRAWALLLDGDIDGYWRSVRQLRKGDGSTLPTEVWVSAGAPSPHRRLAVAVMLPATTPAAGHPVVEEPFPDEDLHVLGLVNAAWEIQQISCTVTDLLGHPAESVIGQSFLRLVHPSDVPELIMTLGTAAGRPGISRTRLRLLTANGLWRLSTAHLTPLAGADLPSFAFMARPERAPGSGDQVVPHDAASRLMRLAHELRTLEGRTQAVADREDQDRDLLALSRREREIVDLLLQGERAPDIARLLVLSQSTVRNHLASAFKKVGVHSQQELMRRFRPSPGGERRHP